jgi:hypothetical protein
MTNKSSRIDLNPTKEMALVLLFRCQMSSFLLCVVKWHQSSYIVVNGFSKMLSILKPLLVLSKHTSCFISWDNKTVEMAQSAYEYIPTLGWHHFARLVCSEGLRIFTLSTVTS